jgi:hypothetical protein
LLHLHRIKLRHGGVTVQTVSIEIEERRFGITRDGAPYPLILSVDDNFETPSQSRKKSGTRRVVRLIAVRGWQKRFEYPIKLLRGGQLRHPQGRRHLHNEPPGSRAHRARMAGRHARPIGCLLPRWASYGSSLNLPKLSITSETSFPALTAL